MNVLMVGPSITQRGGVATIIKQIFTGCQSSSITVKLLSTTVDGRLKNMLYGVWAIFTFIVLCLFKRFDIAHVHLSSGRSCFRKMIFVYICLLFKKPYIIHLHGGRFSYFFEHSLGDLGRDLIRRSFFKANRVIVLSYSWKEWVDKVFYVDSVVIYNGVRRLALKNVERNHPTIIFLGRVCEEKGVTDLLEAFVIVRKTIPKAKLILAGDGQLQFYQESFPGVHNVVFTGWITGGEKQKALSSAAVLCLPSWNEALGISLLEGMAVGLPVVATSVGGIPEVIDHRITGMLVPPHDPTQLAQALIDILSQPDLGREMGEAGYRKFLTQFEESVMLSKISNLYTLV